MLSVDTLILIARAKAPGAEVGFLQSLLTGLYDNNIADGKVLVSTSENGGSVSFSIPEGETPSTLANTTAAAIKKLTGRSIQRLRISFNRAQL